MRVLLSAYACRPGAGSEPGAGWAFALAAAGAGHDVTLLTGRHNESAIEEHLPLDCRGSLTPIYLGIPPTLQKRWDALGRPGRHLHYMVWQRRARRVAQQAHRREPFDVAHHVTLTADWMPAGVTQIKGLPAVWGPIGGAERVPAAGLEWLSWRGRLEEFARRVVSDPMRRVLGRRSAQRAALVIAQNPEAASAVAQTKRPVLVHPNVVLDDPGPANPSGWLGGDDAPHALFVARLHAWKGVHLALAVLQHPDLTKWHLDVIGTGPERRRFLAAVDRLGMADRVHVHGAQSRSEVRGAMAKAEVLLYPSLRDAASWVVGEAQQMGCPIACVATGGPAVLLEAGGGIAVAPTGDLVASLSAAVLSARQLPRTSVSWLSEDLSTVLTRWYELALQAVPAI